MIGAGIGMKFEVTQHKRDEGGDKVLGKEREAICKSLFLEVLYWNQ